ncbi:hypothetical protein AVEN_74640-1 [Araneus ventricosus]|uniref:Uncharacterized protein n=1 Tax=Araneus ventricosus TaxID=182803 RepID=A0A4Y2EXE4_ARAVE|nr:hypothetical protein AVEN_74640-1 [Araneus ventricosus]
MALEVLVPVSLIDFSGLFSASVAILAEKPELFEYTLRICGKLLTHHILCVNFMQVIAGGGVNDHPDWESPIHVASSEKVPVLKELGEKSAKNSAQRATISLKPAFHPFLPSLFSSTHSSRKIRHIHSSEVPKCSGSREERSSFPLQLLFDPPIPSPTPRISDLQPS